MKYKFLLFLFALLVSSTALVYGQNSNLTQIKAHITRANVALTNSDWDSALENVDEAQKLAGRNGAIFESIRVRGYYGKKDYARAKQSMETFYSLNPSQAAITEIAAYETMIDDGIQEEKDRLARMEREEQRRIEAEKKRQAEQAAYEEKLNAVIVQKEGMSAGNKMRDQIWSALFNKSASKAVSVTFRTVVSHDYWGNPEYDNVTLSDNLRIKEARLSGTDYSDYNMTLEYAVNSTRDCRRVNRYEGRNFFLGISFIPSSDKIRVRHNVNIEISPDLFGCTARPIEHRKDFTGQVKRFISDFIEGNANRLRDISLSETEQLAMKKNRDSFMRYFMQRVTSDRKWTYQQMLDQREADRIAAEREAERRRIAEEKAVKEKQRKASYDDLLSAYSEAGRGLDTSEQVLSPMLEKFEDHVSTYPEDALGLKLYAYFLANADRDLEKALTMALKANEIDPGQAHILNAVGWVYTRQKNYEEAREYLTEAYEIDSNPTIDLIRHLITAHYGRYNSLVNAYDAEQAVKYAKYAKANEMDIPLADRVIRFLCPEYTVACSDSYWIESEYKGKWLVSFMKVTPSEDKYQGLRAASNMSEVYDNIEEISGDSYLIDLEYGDDTWHMTLEGGFSGDTKILSNSNINVLSEEIEEYWNSSYHLVDIEYALGKWYVVMLNDEDYPLDAFSYNGSYEKFTEAVKSKSEEGYRLTSMEFGNGFYFGVFIKEPNNALSWNEFSTEAGFDSFMSSKIKDDYAIFYGSPTSDTEYFAIAEKPNSNSNHKYVYFPNIEMIWYDIEQYWDRGYLIKNIEYQK